LKEVNEQNEDDCCICLDNLGYKYVELECKHIFHLECIDTWFRENNTATCPYCKKEYINDITGILHAGHTDNNFNIDIATNSMVINYNYNFEEQNTNNNNNNSSNNNSNNSNNNNSSNNNNNNNNNNSNSNNNNSNNNNNNSNNNTNSNSNNNNNNNNNTNSYNNTVNYS